MRSKIKSAHKTAGSRHHSRQVVAWSVVLLTVGAVSAVGYGSAAGQESSDWDFNGDGLPELTIPASFAPVNGTPDAGQVAVAIGREDGPSKTYNWTYSEADTNVPGVPTEEDRFGRDMASGDLDGDGYADLAVCTEGKPSGDDEEATGLTVFFGDTDGLSETIAVDLSEHDYDYYAPCQGVEVTDVDGDGTDDLVMSFEDKLAWAAGGQSTREPDGWTFDTIDDDVDQNREGRFTAIDSGDINGDGHKDLSYTLTGCETICDYQYIEHRTVLGDGTGGFSPDAEWRIDVTTPPEVLEPTMGDVDGDGFDDVAIGVPNISGHDGRVDLWSGTANGLDADSDALELDQDTDGIPGTSEDDDRFGENITIADLDDDGYHDLVIGVPGEDVGTLRDAGRVVMVPGSENGPDTGNAVGIHQDKPDVPGSVEPYDRFGSFVDNRPAPGQDEPAMLIGAPGENDREGRAYLLGTDNTWWFAPQDFDIEPQDAKFGS